MTSYLSKPCDVRFNRKVKPTPWTLKELQAIAKTSGVKFSHLNKTQLCETLNNIAKKPKDKSVEKRIVQPRPSPHIKAKYKKNERILGNDAMMWKSLPDKNGRYVWRRVTHTNHNRVPKLNVITKRVKIVETPTPRNNDCRVASIVTPSNNTRVPKLNMITKRVKIVETPTPGNKVASIGRRVTSSRISKLNVIKKCGNIEILETPIPGNGDCQFASIGLALGKTSNVVRYEIASALRHNIIADDLLYPAIYSDEHISHLSVYRGSDLRERLIDLIRTPGNTFWGNHLTLTIAAKLYDVCFGIYTKGQNGIPCKTYQICGIDNESPYIGLIYDQDSHYNLAAFRVIGDDRLYYSLYRRNLNHYAQSDRDALTSFFGQ